MREINQKVAERRGNASLPATQALESTMRVPHPQPEQQQEHITMNPHDLADYRSSMQRAAAAFIERHQGEHLQDDGRLFERAVSYLVNSLEVPAFMADRIVHLAMSQGRPAPQPWVGVDMATGPSTTHRLLIDHRAGQKLPVPLRLLPHRFAATAAR